MHVPIGLPMRVRNGKNVATIAVFCPGGEDARLERRSLEPCGPCDPSKQAPFLQSAASSKCAPKTPRSHTFEQQASMFRNTKGAGRRSKQDENALMIGHRNLKLSYATTFITSGMSAVRSVCRGIGENGLKLSLGQRLHACAGPPTRNANNFSPTPIHQ